jgi:hypothetical protein
MPTLMAKHAKYGFGRLIDIARAEPVVVSLDHQGAHQVKVDSPRTTMLILILRLNHPVALSSLGCSVRKA